MIDTEEYWKYSLTFKNQEKKLVKEFSEWLPERIIDCHAHSALKEHVEEMRPEIFSHMFSTFPYFSVKESKSLKSVLFPGKEVLTIRMSKPSNGVNFKEVNNYLLEEASRDEPIILLGMSSDIKYTCSELESRKYFGLKMYYQSFLPPAKTIYEIFPREVLSLSQSMEIPIILHLPKMIVESCGDLLMLLGDFPRLKVILAHLGLPMFVSPMLEDVYRKISSFENVYLDNSFNSSREVFELALKVFGEDRIMFGTDEPINMVRATTYLNPKLGQRLAVEYPYHWVNSQEFKEYGHLAKDAIHFHWHVMNAAKYAIDNFTGNKNREIKEKIFCKNAESFFGLERYKLEK